jgi:hypothetical protein
MGFHSDIPHFYCYIRAEYLYNLGSHHGEFIPVLVFGVDSVAGQAVGFDVLTNFGGMFARMPISALVHKVDAPQLPLDYLELWNNFSYSVEAHEYLVLRHLSCEVRLRDRVWYSGKYMFTLSWYGSNYAEYPGEGGFKRGHIIELENGCYAIQPNNRIKWHEPSFITKKFPEKPDFITNTHIWNCEGNWVTSDDDNYFYNIEERDGDKSADREVI